MGKKKYDPLKSAMSVAGTTMGTSVGVAVPFMVAESLPAGHGRTEALRATRIGTALMPAIPLVHGGSELVKSLKMFDE